MHDMDVMAAAIRETPAPEMRFEKGNRAAIAMWSGEPDASGIAPAIEVRGYHFKSSRTYVITACPITVEEHPGIGRVATYDPLASIRLHVERADRYSEKHLRTLHAAWVAKVRAGHAGDAVGTALADVMGRTPR